MRLSTRRACGILLGTIWWAGCSGPEKPAPSAARTESRKADPARITQLYFSPPSVARGEKSLLCYGVENAKSVRLSPGNQDLSPSISRCIDITATETTTYTLTAQAEGAEPVSKDVTLTIGAPRPKILDVTISALTAKPGDLLSICYKVANTRMVRIEPIGYSKTSNPTAGCTTDQPKTTTTYSVIAVGASGQEDRESVTVKVQ